MAATHTTNLNLNKPDRQDFVSVVTDINDNMEIIDQAVGSPSSASAVTGSDVFGKINALNSNKMNKTIACFTANSTGTTVFDISSNARLFVFVVDSSAPRCGVFIVFANSSGAVTVVDVKTASNISLTGGQNTLTVTYTSGATPAVGFINAYDNLPARNHVTMQT